MQKKVIKISNHEDAVAAAAIVLGFTPEESLVVLGVTSGSPSMRVDLPRTIEEFRELREALQPALRHLMEVLVIVFTSDRTAGEVAIRTVGAWLPNILVLDAFISEPTGEPTHTQADFLEQCKKVTTATKAEQKAWDAYQAGNGALAWGYLDRAAMLGPGLTSMGQDLEVRLYNAISPKERSNA